MNKKHLALVFMAIVLYGILGYVLWWYIEPDPGDAAQKKDFAQLMAQIAVGVALLYGLYFTWRRVEISQKTLETQQDQQVTERFTRAIDQLGATNDEGKPKLEIRLGGIYALERIARDSPERDYSTVIEVLTAYVRQNAPADLSTLPPLDASEILEPPTDIQAVLDVLRRREEQWRPFANVVIDLRRTNLERCNLVGVDLEAANLEAANLAFADLRRATLWRANLEFANLRGARCMAANLKQVEAEGANLQGAILHDSRLESANFVNADLQTASRYGAQLRGAIFHDTDLMQADLREADLEGVVFLLADLRDADLRGADLRGAQDLTQDQIEDTIGDETTQLPEHLTRPASWAI